MGDLALFVVATLLVVVLALVIVLTGRHTTAPANPMPSVLPIAGGSIGMDLADVHGRLDVILESLTDLHAAVTRRPAGAAPLGTLPPKEHRPQFVLTSEERTNKVLRKIYTCRVEGCPDTLIDEAPEPSLLGVDDG